ncbi:hypothetical protein NDA16_003131 [Ustilago loliicola]|nr:hypothetical protein NDA16_003131 [Ustilago loliicola]
MVPTQVNNAIESVVRMTSNNFYSKRRSSEFRFNELNGKHYYQFWGLPVRVDTPERVYVFHYGLGFLEESDVDAVEHHLQKMREAFEPHRYEDAMKHAVHNHV